MADVNVGTGRPLPQHRVAFVLEQTLGHITHAENLRAFVPPIAAELGFEPVFLPISFEMGRAARVPGWSNWTMRAGVRARRAIRDLERSDPPDALFVHTQVPAMLLSGVMRRTPTVVSVDATPRQYDELGAFYRHTPGPAPVERLKHRLHLHTFRRARRVVTWSAWARDGLVADYGLAEELVSVIPPGVDIDRWQPWPRATDDRGPLEVLFVGGDLVRKGGDLLIEACARLRARDDVPEFVLHIVTGSPLASSDGVVVHQGLTPNSPGLVARFRSADVFCLPTLGDCLPLVLAEAGAAGLPLISTAVGAIHEIVQPGSTGELIPPGDLDALTEALAVVLGDPVRRLDLGMNARQLIERDHDAAANARRVLDVVVAALD